MWGKVLPISPFFPHSPTRWLLFPGVKTRFLGKATQVVSYPDGVHTLIWINAFAMCCWTCPLLIKAPLLALICLAPPSCVLHHLPSCPLISLTQPSGGLFLVYLCVLTYIIPSVVHCPLLSERRTHHSNSYSHPPHSPVQPASKHWNSKLPSYDCGLSEIPPGAISAGLIPLDGSTYHHRINTRSHDSLSYGIFSCENN